MDRQGGKAFGILKAQQDDRLEAINKDYLENPEYNANPHLEDMLRAFKEKYMEFDLNNQGDIGTMGLKKMLENLGAAKTHLELKKMIREVTGDMSDTISYQDFVKMMLKKRSAIAKIIMIYEDKAKEPRKPIGFPTKKSFSDLP
ncbi:allograft inflammatory factor 1-like [Leucoraja erinacea]|uniref:allograft inflammatory factor 1-like n=1 Tax=Leucoraja erinaceus TaxID=7782 RepID=UPI002457E51B|nr:allograft inflammatory factor 1-like [Leucoraja erinacea]